MTLLWMDGFDLQDVTTIYDSVNMPVTGYGFSQITRFCNGSAWQCGASSGRWVQKNIVPSQTVITGIARCWSNTLGQEMLSLFASDSTQHLTLMSRTDGGIDLRRGTSAGTVIASSAAGLIPASFGWFYWEVKAKVDDTVGFCVVRMNLPGGAPSTIINFSGDTRNAGAIADIYAVRHGCHNNTYLMDDMYICDGLGTRNNDFLGDIVVQPLAPDAPGAYAQLVASAGANWDAVNEFAFTATDYVGSATVGQRDTYSLQSLAAYYGGTVIGVKTTKSQAKTGTAAIALKDALKIGSSVYNGPARSLQGSYLYSSDTYESSPATSAAWTLDEVASLEVGVEVAAA